MRENRTYGSEGGGTGITGPPYPYPVVSWCLTVPRSSVSLRATDGLAPTLNPSTPNSPITNVPRPHP